MSSSDDPRSDQSKTIAEAARSRVDLSTLAKVLAAAALTDILASPGPFTVFAPNDAAFSKLPSGEVDRLMQPENRIRLTSLVARHILAGQLTASEMRERATAGHGHLLLHSVDNEPVCIEQAGERLRVGLSDGGKATITNTDLLLANGVIHMTDAVLLSPVC